MKAQELVSKVQGYATEKGLPASKACEALNLNPRTYYAAVQRVKNSTNPSPKSATVPEKAKRGRPPVAAAKKAVTVDRPAPIQTIPFAHSSKQTFLVVGDPASIAEVARALGAK